MDPVQHATTQPYEAPPAAPNGAAADLTHPPPAPAGLVIGRKLVWLPKREDHSDAANHFRAAYPGFAFQIWTNYDRQTSNLFGGEPDETTKESEARLRRALKRIVLAHNGWQIHDEDVGGPVLLPPPSTDEFWDRIPTDLATAMIIFIGQAATALPNSMSPQRRNSGRG